VQTPKGFGKKYFTFASILAHSIHSKIQALSVKTSYLLEYSKSKESDIKEEDDPPFEFLLATNVVAAKKPCHCNCFYRLKIKLILKQYLFIPRCPYYTTYFAFRRTGVHPPFYTS